MNAEECFERVKNRVDIDSYFNVKIEYCFRNPRYSIIIGLIPFESHISFDIAFKKVEAYLNAINVL